MDDRAVTLAQQLVESLNRAEESNVERLLIRQVHKYYYSCQVWYDDGDTATGHYLSLEAVSEPSDESVERSGTLGKDQ